MDRYATDRGLIDSTFSLQEPNQGDIREDYRQRAQSAINAVNAKYAVIDAQDRASVDLASREQRAANMLGGLSGSTAGSARTIQTANEGKALVDRTAAQKKSEVAALLNDAEVRGTEEFTREREAFLSQQKDRFAAEQSLSERIRTDARAEIEQIATSMSYDEFAKQSPKLLAQYMKETGMSELGLKAAFLSGAKANLISDKPEIIGNKAIWFSQNADGTISKTEVEIPEAGKSIKDSRITDAGIQVLYEDGTYEVLGGGTSDGGGEVPVGTSGALSVQPGYSKLTAGQKKQADSLNNLVRSLKEYRTEFDAKVGDSGSEMFGENAALLESKLNSIIFAAAQAEGTGALQAADREVIEQIVPNPTTVSGSWNAVRKGGKKGSIAKIEDQIKKYTDNLSTYGLTPVEPQEGDDVDSFLDSI